ncbi:MAG: transcriptional regulator, AraC family [Ramlibacter sp.]|jgi:AraC family transcriptional regulator|nr:transcriptional regulator, AraC family [Ramlibacter sp.]
MSLDAASEDAPFAALPDAPLASIALLPAASDDPGPRHAVRILIPADGAAASIAYSSAGRAERKAFVRAPMVAVIPPGQACRIRCQRAGDTLALEIGSGFFAAQVRTALGTAAPQLVAPHAAIDPFIREIGNALRSELVQGHAVAGALEPLAALVAVHLARRYAAAAAVGAAPAAGLPQHKLQRVQDYVEAHLAESIRVEHLAAQVHMSPFHFARMFKKATGQPPHLYVVMRRIERAKALLRGSETGLIHLAAQIGFRTQGHFTGVFRRYTGCTPAAFRLESRQPAPS